MSVTIRDVARRAEVSAATVSRVLNDTCPVHEDKRARVLEAAQALGYVPHPAALSLLNKESGSIGVLLPFVSAEFFSAFLTGLDQAAQGLGFFLTVSTSHRHEQQLYSAIRVMDRRVDGLIIMAPELDPSTARSIARINRPVVLVNTYAEHHPDVDVINFDNYGGAYALTRHLLDLGHRNVAHIVGPSGAWDAQERRRGYRAALEERGAPGLAPLEVQGDYTQDAGYAATKELVASLPRPTAIVAANDYCAMGAIRALFEAGVAVPGEMAVAGFDGTDSGGFTLPTLTTVKIPMREIGRRAVGRLVGRLRGYDASTPPDRQVVPLELVVRGSTAPLEGPPRP